jgi:hypothetical protein
MDPVQEFKQQYLMTQKAREEDFYGKDHMMAMSKLEKLFYKIPENQIMGICEKECQQDMVFRPVTQGWAAVCECDQSYFMKTFQAPNATN